MKYITDGEIIARNEDESVALCAARDAFTMCLECEGEGGFSNWATRGPQCNTWDCEACNGEGESAQRVKEWPKALALWNATPGDSEARYAAVNERFPDWDVAERLGDVVDEFTKLREAPEPAPAPAP